MAIAVRDWLADHNFQASAAGALVITGLFIRKNVRHQHRRPPTGAMAYVLFEALACSAIVICLLRLLTGVFHKILFAEEEVCFFVGSIVLLFILYGKISKAFAQAAAPTTGTEPRTEDY